MNTCMCFKAGFTNRTQTQMQHAKTKQSFNVDLLSRESTRGRDIPRPNRMRMRLPWRASVDSNPNWTKLNWTVLGCLIHCLSLSQRLSIDQSETRLIHALCDHICTQCGWKNLSVLLPQWQTSVFIVELNLIMSASRHGSPWGMRHSALVRNRSLKNIFVSKATQNQTECEWGCLV